MPSFDRLNKRALTLITVSALTACGVKMRSLPYKRSLFRPSKNLEITQTTENISSVDKSYLNLP